MNKETTAETLKMILVDPLTTFGHKIASILPNIIGAIVMLVIGYFIAKALSYVIKAFSTKLKLDAFAEKLEVDTMLQKLEINSSFSDILTKISFYIIFMIFIMSAAETLELNIMAGFFESILTYLPNIIVAMLILLFGLFIANKVNKMIINNAIDMNIDYGEYLGKMVYFFIIVISFSLAIGQLQIEITLLNQVASIILVAIGLALAISLGLGSKELSSHAIAGSYIKDIYKIGDHISIDEIEGEIIQLHTTKVIIKTKDESEISISNIKLLNEKVTKIK